MRKKITILTLISMLVVFFAVASVYASTLFQSFIVAKGSISTGSIDKVVDVSSDVSSVEVYSATSNLTFNKANDSNDVSFEIRNRTSSIIDYRYKFSLTSPYQDKDESLASSILVYYNSQFINTLANICYQNGEVREGDIYLGGYLNKASSTYTSLTDKITFTLARGSEGSLNDGATSIPLNISVYSSTVDYSKSMYVSSFSEFKRSVEDLNTGILSDPKIILLDDLNINENIEIKYPFTLDLNGHSFNNASTMLFSHSGLSTFRSGRAISSTITTNGSYVVNNAEGLLYVEDLYDSTASLVTSNISSKITATAYSSALLEEILVNNLKNESTKLLTVGSSYDILKGLSSYTPTINTSAGLSYTKPNISVLASTTSKNETITIGEEVIPFKINTSSDDTVYQSILDEELEYIVSLTQINSSGNIIRTNSKDLFLPTAINSKNATLTWSSSNPKAMTDDGIISDKLDGNQTVTLYLTTRVNTSVYTEEFKIRLMSQNHQTLFEDFVAQLSPIRLETMYDGTNSRNSYYFLPIVDSNYDVDSPTYSGYDYRASYNTPKTEDLLPGMAGYSWPGFSNVGFEYITYTLISAYNFIGLDTDAVDSNSNHGIALYLSQATFQTFAQINVKAKYKGDDEIHEGVVNILVNTGYSTELNELVFNKVNQDLSNVDVLQNILDTRKSDGMSLEKGDFELDGVYNTYYITYSIPLASRGAITTITGYDKNGVDEYVITGDQTFTIEQALACTRYVVSLNPEYFENTESSFAITTTLVMPTGNTADTASRDLYFKAPGVIKPDSYGFENISIFNSVKYQVWYELANNVENESVDGDVREDDYTLSSDTASFTTSSNVITNHTRAYILRHDAALCKTLAFSNVESVTSTDNHKIYGLYKIIDFILSDKVEKFGLVYTGDISIPNDFVSDNYDVYSNGKDYISDSEKALLKNYYLQCIKNDGTAFDELFKTITNVVKDGYGNSKKILVNGAEFISSVKTYFTNTTTYGTNRTESVNGYNKFLEVIQWAHNDKDFEALGGNKGIAPNYGVIGVATWSNTSNYYTLVTTDNWSPKAKPSSYTNSFYYNSVSRYVEDDTSYITYGELEIILAFLLNLKTNSSYSPSNAAYAYIKDLRDTYFVIPTYFNDDGIVKLIAQAYKDLDKSVSGGSSTGFEAEMTSFTVMGDTVTTPHITALDGSFAGLDYFTNLETLYLIGDYDNNLKTFHLTNTLSNFFNRITSNNTKIKNLAIEYASDSNIDFKIDNISSLKELINLDLYHNQGITNIGHLLKVNYSNIRYVDVADINVSNTYSDFTLRALKYKQPQVTIYYANSRIEFENVLEPAAEGLIYIDEFSEMLTESTNLVQIVYTESGSQDVKWAIEEGNSITLVTESGTIDTLTPYTDYFLATADSGDFVAGHVYLIKLVGDAVSYQDIGAVEIVDSIPAELTPEEIAYYTSGVASQSGDNSDSRTITGSVTGAFSNVSTNDYTGTFVGNSTTKKTMVIKDSDGNTIATLGTVYGFHYNSSVKATRQTVASNYYYSYDHVQVSPKKYYAVQENGHYVVKEVTYNYTSYTNVTKHNMETTYNESVYNYVYSYDYSNYILWQTYKYKSIFEEYPNAATVVIGGSTYELFGGNRVTTEVVNDVEKSSELSSKETVNEIDNTSNYIDTMVINATVASEIETMLNKKYFDVASASYNEGGTNRDIPAGIRAVGVSTSGGFTYTDASSMSTELEYAAKMDSILQEANANINTSKYGLYYHHYYAYTGDDVTYNGYTYLQSHIYYLDVVNGEFVWVHLKAYEELTGDYQTVVNKVTSLTSANIGEIYYYTGESSGAMTQGTNVWYKVVQNAETGAYEFIKFGELSKEFDIVNASSGVYSKELANQNENGFNAVCNIVRYMDTGDNTSTYTYGVGGERTAVLKAIITVGGMDYERYFLVNVIG
ncbi:MAG: hypothetical protein IJU60_06260 [Acholeplasmatales bacterium]|nr:hypothetical protein [Acholeplasmatales bacterium]